jgi:hypothetical protein
VNKAAVKIVLLSFVMIFFSCGKNPFGFLYTNGPGTFTAAPLDVSEIQKIRPLGRLNPPVHTIPASHTSYVFDAAKPPRKTLAVYAPASGSIIEIVQPEEEDYKVRVQVTQTFTYFLNHIMLNDNLAEGDFVAAGDPIGTTSTQSASIDFGVINTEYDVKGYVNQNRYMEKELHKDSPLKYYESNLQTQLYALVSRNSPDKDGVFAQDQEGKLIGNWFHGSVPNDEDATKDQENWNRQLAFVYEHEYPTLFVISIGGHLNGELEGVFRPQDGALAPEKVTTASDTICYNLDWFDPDTSHLRIRAGYLLVKMTGNSAIKVEAVADTAACGCACNQGFTSGSEIYVR